MALKQALAVEWLSKNGIILEASLCEISGGWLALVDTEAGRRLGAATRGECPLHKFWKDAEVKEVEGGITVVMAALNANNAAVVRRFVKWAAPTACGTKGVSIGFSDWSGCADAFVTELFAKKQLRPVLVDFTPSDSEALGRNFLEAVDTATWGVLAAGYREGYGANAASLAKEDDIVKALLYGYSMIGVDCTEKINLEIEKLSAEQVAKKFEEFKIEFQAALRASYLNAEFKVNDNVITFTEEQLQRIVLEYGEAIMHIQYLYNTYLKSTPWAIDFELDISKPGKTLSVQEHYLIANELKRNNINLSGLCVDGVNEADALRENLQIHADIADTFNYRLSIKNMELSGVDAVELIKATKGKVHMKYNNVLWMCAVHCMEQADKELYAKVCAAAETEAAAVICGSPAMKALAMSYTKALAKDSELAKEIKAFLTAHKEEYKNMIITMFGDLVKRL